MSQKYSNILVIANFWHLYHVTEGIQDMKSTRCAWFGLVLRHINHWSLFNAKFSSYVYIKYMIWFGLVWFNGISIIVGYLMPNPLYTYISNTYDLVWLGFMAIQPL